ncbi:hypothetical protein LCGC14_1289730, partial [marine sediment metagenome]
VKGKLARIEEALEGMKWQEDAISDLRKELQKVQIRCAATHGKDED